LKNDIGRLPLAKITAMRIQQLYAEMMARPLSPLTIRRLHTVLNQALKQAVRWRMLAHNPAADTDLPANRTAKVIRAMTLEQAQAFLVATLGDRWGCVLRFAVRTGMRPEEYFALQWSDIDFDQAVARISKVVVHPKGGGWKFEEPKTAGSRRTVALDPVDLEELRTHRTQQLQERLLAGDRWKTDHDFVFTNELGGPMHMRNLAKRSFKPALKKAQLSDKFRPYDLRHTCATLLLLSGENVKVVSERLGHASVSITLDTYSHVLPTMQQSAARKMGAMLGTPVAPPEHLQEPAKVVAIAGRRRG
jgi:integrase